MMKSIRALLKQLKERYRVPRRVQDVIPIHRIWEKIMSAVRGAR